MKYQRATELSRVMTRLQEMSQQRNKKLSKRMYEKFKRRMLFEIEKSTSDTIALHLYNVLLSEKEAVLKEVCVLFFLTCF